MKKSAWIMILVILGLGISLVSADEMKDKMMGGEMMDKDGMGMGMMEDKGGMMMRKKGMMAMDSMMKSMMEKTIMPTSDGGIIVVFGNKLTKYDKDLNVVKEVELNMDMGGMQKMMDGMKGMCPMMGGGMMGGMNKKMDDSSGAQSPSSEVDHASHH